jgi:CPA1 family monovalent cation:H+ antiporter
MAGEALFNDGVGVVLFIVLMRVVESGNEVSIDQSVLLFVKEAFGGILIALALSIPPGPHRGIVVFVTYMVVAFSIVVQGLTLKKMLRRWEV